MLKNWTYSGFKSLDKVIGGLPYGDLIVIAGRPSMGKTSLAINIACYALHNYRNQVCIFSLEMNKKQILHKLVSISSKIPITNIVKGKITKKQWQIVQQICKELLESNIYINDTANISIEEIIEILNTIYKDANNKILLIIDYLQLIQTYNLNNSNRSEELSYITRKLKILAQNLYIPIIILSQLNRNVDTRSNKKPLLSDLRESGCLSYKLFVHVQYINQINILNILSNTKHQIAYIKNKIFIYKTNRNSVYNLNYIEKYDLFKEEAFIYLLHYKRKIITTDTHSILVQNSWSKQCITEQNNPISTYILISKYKSFVEKYPSIFILTYNKDLVYEINRHEYLNFLYFFTILHNSIEQDADIVIMLYSNNSITQSLVTEKIIDLIVLKNRNGSIGSLQLLFNCPSTVFKDINKE